MATAALIPAHWPLTKVRLLSKVVLQAMVAHSSLIAPIWVSAILEVRLRLNMSGSPFAYTWAARPRYRMTGCHTWGGTFSGPVGVSREESKNSLDSGNLLLLPIYACVDGPLRSTRKTPSVASIMMDPPPSPRAKLAMPVRALMASDAQLPAGLSAPGPQFRKNCWLTQINNMFQRIEICLPFR